MSLFFSPSHTSVISTRYPTGQSGVGPLGSSSAKLDANVAIRLCLNSDGHVLISSASNNNSSCPIFRSDSDTLILRRADSRAPGESECAGVGHLSRYSLVHTTARQLR